MRRLPRRLRRLEPWLQSRRYWLDDERYVDEIDRVWLCYHERGRSIDVGYEDLTDGDIVLFPEQMKPWAPPGVAGTPLDDAERNRIVEAIRDAFASRGRRVADPSEVMPAEVGIAILEARNRATDATRESDLQHR